MFATHGLPEVIISDNAAVFTSAEFVEFLKGNGIRHMRAAPYSPASNGFAEKCVGIIKQGLRKHPDGDIHCRLAKILLSYRRTPHTTTGQSPAEMLYNRQLRSRIDLLRPDLISDIHAKQEEWSQVTTRDREYVPGDCVYMKNYTPGQQEKWKEGIVEKVHSPHSIMVRHSEGVTQYNPRQLRRERNNYSTNQTMSLSKSSMICFHIQ